MANRIGNPECLADWNMTTVEKSVRCCRFFVLATCAPAGIGRFPLAKISMATFPAGIAIRPLLTGNELQAGFICLEFLNPDPCKVKYHNSIIIPVNGFLQARSCKSKK